MARGTKTVVKSGEAVPVVGCLERGARAAISGTAYELTPWREDKLDGKLFWRCKLFATGIGSPPRTSVEVDVQIDEREVAGKDEAAVRTLGEERIKSAMAECVRKFTRPMSL